MAHYEVVCGISFLTLRIWIVGLGGMESCPILLCAFELGAMPD